jgi:uncharacterized protein Yka (UPF0111/DUF47 family)
MPGLLGKILPREKSFFDMFVQQAENVHQGTMALLDMLENYDHEAARRVSEVTAYEHKGDTITHGIITRLNQTFITPFDREDIHELASKIDDVIDLVDAAARRFVTYDIKCVRPGTVRLFAGFQCRSATMEWMAVSKLVLPSRYACQSFSSTPWYFGQSPRV